MKDPCKMLTRKTARGHELESLSRQKTTKKGQLYSHPCNTLVELIGVEPTTS